MVTETRHSLGSRQVLRFQMLTRIVCITCSTQSGGLCVLARKKRRSSLKTQALDLTAVSASARSRPHKFALHSAVLHAEQRQVSASARSRPPKFELKCKTI